MKFENKKKKILYLSVLLAVIIAGLLVIGQIRSKQTRGAFEFSEIGRAHV